MEAIWQGLSATLTTPHKKHPSAAIPTPPAIHSLIVISSSLIIAALLGNAQLFECRHDAFLVQKPHMATDLLAFLVVEYLGRNAANAESLRLLTMLPDIDEDDGGTALYSF